jgi:FAD:protein FMN transferase
MQLEQFQFKAMGSPCELLLYCPDKATSKPVIAAVKAEIDRLESKYTRFRETSLTAKINANAGVCSTEIDTETNKLLSYADTLFDESDGLFDITSGVLRKAWDFKSGKLPSADSIQALLPLVSWPSIERSEESIYLPHKGMQIDFGGFVKEYAADVAANLCRELGIESGLVNLGGDIHVIGPHPGGKGWKVGIQHPRELTNAITSLSLYQGSIATSGDYERYMLVDGHRYCHLLNPKTGMSIQPRFASTSVIADSCVVAGSCATIAMLKSDREPNWLDELEVPYLSIDQSMQLEGPLSSDVANK